jgi:Antitoxin SocA-like, Panacea domain
LQKAGQSITDAEYLKAPYGPVPTQGDFALEELQKRRLIRIKRVKRTDEPFMREIIGLVMPDTRVFTAQEMKTIHDVMQQYGEDTASVLSWKIHQEDAWLNAADWRPLQLSPNKPLTESENKNAAAIAWVQQWYATPDAQPPGFWEEFEEVLKANPIDFGDKNLES